MKIYHGQEKEIEKLFVGKSIVKAEGNLLTLSDGTVLEIEGNEGCGGCSGGDYHLDRLNTFSNVITSVEINVGDKNPEQRYSDTLYQIFVYSEGIGLSVADISGDDGSGYYGTGFAIEVKQKPVEPESSSLPEITESETPLRDGTVKE